MTHPHKQTPAAPTTIRRIAERNRGRKHGPTTRLISPSDLGELLKPFVFLDLFEHEGPPFEGGLHPHSGIATLTYVTEGSVPTSPNALREGEAQISTLRKRLVQEHRL